MARRWTAAERAVLASAATVAEARERLPYRSPKGVYRAWARARHRDGHGASRPWTAAENAQLRETGHVPGRTPEACRIHAHRLGIRRRRPRFPGPPRRLAAPVAEEARADRDLFCRLMAVVPSGQDVERLLKALRDDGDWRALARTAIRWTRA